MPLEFDARQIAAFVLVGGRSQRMGSNKARLLWQGDALARVLVQRLRPLTASVSLLAKASQEYADLHVPVVCDALAEPALVHGIAAALRQPGPPWRLVLACDMPGVGAAVVRALWSTAQRGGRGSYPLVGNHHEPLPSLWHHDLQGDIADAWGLKAQDWLRHAGLTPWRVPDEDRRRLANVNTPADWQAWLRQEGDVDA